MTGPAALLPSPEQDLITLARRGDRLAFGELVQRHRPIGSEYNRFYNTLCFRQIHNFALLGL